MHIRTFQDLQKSSSSCLHLLLEAIFQRVFKLPRWQRLGFVLQVLTRGSTPFHKKCTTVLPHLDLEMHEFLKKDLAAVEILKTWSWSRAGSQAFEGNHPKGLSSAPFVTFCLWNDGVQHHEEEKKEGVQKPRGRRMTVWVLIALTSSLFILKLIKGTA